MVKSGVLEENRLLFAQLGEAKRSVKRMVDIATWYAANQLGEGIMNGDGVECFSVFMKSLFFSIAHLDCKLIASLVIHLMLV